MHTLNIRPALTLLSVLVLSVAGGGRAAAAPPAPTPLAPANNATVQIPFAISWSAVSDPAGIVAYNWQVSPSSSFTPVVQQNSTSGQTQDTVGGLATGIYFWRVQAVSGAFVQGAWSPPLSFNVSGAGPGAPGTPLLQPTKAYSTFHPFELMTFNWSAVPDATTYVLQFSADPGFPVITRGQFDNIPNTTFAFAIGNPEGNYSARVFAVNANGIAGVPSNVINFSVFFNNPIGPPPVLLSPPNGTTLTLPVTLTWADVPNPQDSGYELSVANDAGFANLEFFFNQITPPTETLLSLTPGTKFWRVRSAQGAASPTTSALTAFSTVGTFTISSAPATPVSVTLALDPLSSGDTTWVMLQLTAGVPASGALIGMTSSNPSAAPVPSTITMPGNTGWTQFQMQAGQVVAPTPVTLTATLNSGTASVHFIVQPPSLKSLSITPSSMSGGSPAGGIVMLNGQAPPGGAVVSLSSNSPAASVPSTVTVPPGSFSAPFTVATSNVTASTPVTISASWNGVTVQSPITVIPGAAPTSLTLFPATTIGGGPGSVDGRVTIASAVSFDQFFQVTSNNPAVLPFLSSSVQVPAFSTTGLIQILPTVVSVPTIVTISVTGGGVTRSANLTVNPASTPPPPATLSSFTVSPTSVVGGTPATGTVTLPSAAPPGGTVVSLTSNLPLAASVPASVTVAAGATSANFTVTTFPAATTTVQLSARVVDTILFASIGVSPSAPSSPTLSSVTVSPTTVVGGNSSTGTVTLSAAAPSGGAVVTLSSSNTGMATVPSTVAVAAGSTSRTFTVTTLAVASSTPVTISGSFGASRAATLTVTPPAAATPSAPTLVSPATDATPAQPVTFDWSDVTGATSYEIQVDDSSSFTVPLVVGQTVTPSQFTTGGFASVRHWWRVRGINSAGTAGSWSVALRFQPKAAPAAAALSAIGLSPASVVGGSASQGTATLTSAAPTGGAVVTLSSSNTAVATAPASVTVAAGATSATFNVTTTAVGASTPVTITGVNGGATKTATLSVTPPPPPASLSAVSVSPASVPGGTSAQATVTLTSAAPAGGIGVTLTSSNGAATVPGSVTVAAGATSATAAIATTSVTASTVATITANAGGVTRTAGLTVAPPAATGTATLTVTATGRSGEGVTSSPAGINVAVGSTGSAPFTTGTSITLTISNGRDAIWSGACSSGGSKAKTCTFTLTGTATLTANVQ
ncbi:MAG: hypothetical protein DMF95_12720 [Acidobacteria bacterium]|nr:MAG: hypothetical protein DMF95_12720 [Acidobacteriota bacterium]